MTGFRREGKWERAAGHDINYLAVSGVLSLLGRKGERPYAPGNLLGDFAGGGLVLFAGVLLALLERERTGKGQVVEANMVDGAAHLATFPRLALKGPLWDRRRGENVLDGGCPWYDTYATKDGKYMAVGAMEPQFFAKLVEGLGLDGDWNRRRMDRGCWEELRTEIVEMFRSRTRKEWEDVFDGTDACCTPVLDHEELEKGGHDQRPIVTLRDSPALAVHTKEEGFEDRDAAEGQGRGHKGSGWRGVGLAPGEGGEEVLQTWMGWQRGKQYDLVNGSLVLVDSTAKAKL